MLKIFNSAMLNKKRSAKKKQQAKNPYSSQSQTPISPKPRSLPKEQNQTKQVTQTPASQATASQAEKKERASLHNGFATTKNSQSTPHSHAPKNPPNSRSSRPPRARQIPTWDYDTNQKGQGSDERLKKKELSLWIAFFILLSAVIFFSQRNWLTKIFPVQKHPQLHLSVEVLHKAQNRKNSNSPSSQSTVSESNLYLDKASTTSHKNDAQNTEKEAAKNGLLQRFDKLLRSDDALDNPSSSTIQSTTNQGLQAAPKDQKPTRDVRLFFVKVKEDGQLQLTGTLHKVPFDNTPLSQTLDKLLKGPETQEINKGLHSMLPPEMQILRIRVVGNTVFLDLSTEFYSIMHLPAVLLAAVEQLVFTITEFPTIKSLRLLVDGQPIFPENLPSSSLEYLRQQNINLNSELTRENLWQE